MKRKISYFLTLLIAVFTVFSFVSCDDDEINFEPRMFFSSDTVLVKNTGGEGVLGFLSNENWQLESNSSWIIFTTIKGAKGRHELEFFAEENLDDPRTAIVNFTSESGVSGQVEIIQEAGNLDDIYVKVGGTGDGKSWEKAASLEAAMGIAVTGNTIHIAAGTYSPTKTITGGDDADVRDLTFELGTNLTLKGGYPADAVRGSEANPELNASILSGGNSSYHVVTITAPVSSNPEEKLVIDGLTISGGRNDSSSSGSVAINGERFYRAYGGGILIVESKVDILNSTITNNEARYGAGMYANSNCIITFKNTKIQNNIAQSFGGGIYGRRASNITIMDSEINGNSSGSVAGGLYALTDVIVNVYNSKVVGNMSGGHGAGVYLRDNAKGNFVNVMIAGNSNTSGGGTGGGIMMYDTNVLNLVSCTISENEIGEGGGMWGRLGTNTANIYNSIISGNTQGSGSEIGETNPGEITLNFKSSVAEAKIYDASGNEISGATFIPTSMLSNFGDWNIIATGSNNPAIEHGMNLSALTNVGDNLDPAAETSITGNDLYGNSRATLTTMGALVKTP